MKATSRTLRGRAPVAAVLAAAATVAAASASPTTWSFDADAAGAAPAGFRFEQTGGGPPVHWVVREESAAPSAAHVLTQSDVDGTNDRFSMAVADALSLADLRLSVKCKPIAGKVDRACGLVFRYRDANNYYVTRANALEDNVRLYFVKEGRRRQIASWSGAVSSNTWHELSVEARGDRFEIHWNGAKILEAQDQTFGEAGRVGVWTKADSVTLFDDLSVAPL